MLDLAERLAAEHQLVLDTDDRALFGEAFALFSPDRAHRYLLGRRWVADLGRVAVWVMLNPSTADAFRLDQTLRKCMAFSRRWGCGGMLIANLFAYRATKPKDMLAAADPIGDANDAVLAALADQLAGRALWIGGWGNHAKQRGELIADHLATWGVTLQALNINNSGTPQHPLYVPGDAELTPMPRGIVNVPAVEAFTKPAASTPAIDLRTAAARMAAAWTG